MIKSTTASFIAALVISGAVSLPALAKQPVELVDSNGDGVISALEIQEACGAKKVETLAQYDVDGNGELSREERGVLRSNRQSELLSLFDADGDGELSKAERLSAKDARKQAMEAQLDVNNDGVLSDLERAGFEEVKELRGDDKDGGCGGKGRHQHPDNDAA